MQGHRLTLADHNKAPIIKSSRRDSIMISVILAAGRGRRMGSGNGLQLKDPLPKILLSFGGRSLLERHLAILESCGIGEVFVVVGYGADQIREEVARIEPRVSV